MSSKIAVTKKEKREHISFFLFLSPWLLGFLAFTLIPMVASIYYSFNKIFVYNMSVVPPEFVGLKNFVMAFSDKLFLKSIANTFVFALFRVPIGIIAALMVACLLNRKIAGKKLFRTLVYLPAILPIVGSVIIWKQLFSNDFSLLNYILGGFGIGPVNWLHYDNALWSIILMSVWCGIGPSMIILLAALQGVPERLLEAAELDGAGAVRKFFSITIPMISPTLFYLVITGIIGALQAYAEMALLSVPGDSTVTMTMVVVRNMYKFDGNGIGYSSAMSWIIFVIVMVFTLIFFKISSKAVYYGSGD
ncbi:MAG: carbohydrate ABC transporter permease [Christensenellales bacterium]